MSDIETSDVEMSDNENEKTEKRIVLILGHSQDLGHDGVHLTQEASETLARRIYDRVSSDADSGEWWFDNYVWKMSEIDALVRSRGGYKGVITKWVNKIDSAIAAGNANTLSSIKYLIMKQMKIVHDLNEKILALTTEEDRMKEVEETTYGKKDEIKRVLVRRLLEMESPSPDSEALQSFRANFECSIISLESENLELNELYTILLHRSCNAPPVQETQVTVLKLATNEEVIEATLKFDSDIKNDLDILWNLDKVGIDCNELKEHDRKVLEDFESTIVYSEMEKQYVVALPWKSNKSRLPSNFGMALGRVKQQCAKFKKDEAYLNHYQKILKDQEDRGFIERVDKNNVVENCPYLAHHSVQKDSATTPIRIVFDSFWRQGKNGLSLNDCLWTGPHITTDLLKVLLQFRTNNYACISDIEKAFLMVQLREEDHNYTRCLWLQNPTDPNSELIIYRFRVVLFGATCSPFLLNATIKSHLAVVRKDTNCTEMVDMMRRGLYVDNLQFTSNNEDELINLFFGSNKIFAQAHLYLREWTSNSDLLNTIPGAYRIKSEEKQTYKVLGLNWNISNDKLTITPNHLKTGQTKREILSAIAQIYDPLGMLIPITIRARIFLQDLWKQQLIWDDLLSVPLLEQWNELSKDLEKSLSISFSRGTNLEKTDYLHIFCDASVTAYGCVAYRVSGKTLSLIMAKGRVAPIKELTVPKLELMALLLGARLCEFIVETFEEDKFEKIIICSDSKVALGWLVTKNNLPVFVKNRVLEINSITTWIVFSYVPSSENPSDWITRSKRTEEVRNNSFW
ncbi:uncharacterized protein [Palaemon carinicauda]|uniref:uncharacterized protein n=1 Tax=Palaemon carinicauda TaxID=392227 RepID=UPI0035B67EBC